ncbi:uncharacterized protein B0I36DRAFT_416023 [Microdochium trichocladiopsis]|uniref:Hydantoinase/oxoprolinase n=1 Tax=Microdochium trichocladiopsis TaxID=1682393 RepID=A0A9P8XXV6_9PEZI|nr:uncharacterized protein B0I36DRAFT_416023 [Microdochium trichocladiopsis]KAH7024574.1 hypothetical protein B0I36DRAFT_416023 [Microdochium trichocladiopsis]
MAVGAHYRIGVDVDPGESSEPNRGIRSAFKTPTTPDVTEGIKAAIQGAINKADVTLDSIASVMIGTTHFINAVVQADERHLRPVGVMRICGPYTKENPAFLDFPPILRRIMRGHVSYLDGGLEFDTREIMPLNEDQIRQECATLRSKGIQDIAIVGIFSPLDIKGLQEEAVRKIVLQELPDADVVLSSEIGQLGYLERENATILNTSILKFARSTIKGFKQAISLLGLTCPLFLTQNDGTIIDALQAEKCPIKTFSSGPTNSMSGAAYLSGLDTRGAWPTNAQVIVADIGGTTTDVCALLPSGFPRQAGTWVEIGGVRSSFSMPEVFSVALGGGTKVEVDSDGKVHVGPESVGHRLISEGLVFGGNTLTTTDVAVALGKANIGDASRVKDIPVEKLSQARSRIKKLLEYSVDSMKLSADDATVILVGGGSVVHMDDLEGVNKIIRPQFHDCANAVGAAIAKVSGQVDTVEVLEGRDEKEVVAAACEEAKQKAIEAGADPLYVEVTSVENMPLEYVAMKATRLIIRAAGPLSKTALLVSGRYESTTTHADDITEHQKASIMSNQEKHASDFIVSPSASVDIRDYRPEVDEKGIWWVSEIDCEFLATGCSILACGGGGPGYMCYLAARAAIQQGHRLPIVEADDLDPDTWVMGSVSYGAPTVTTERLPSGTEAKDATDALLTCFPGVKMGAQIAIEIGGMNGLRPLVTATDYNVPTIDGDYMGRAYPRLYLMTPFLFGESATPCTQADGNGNVVTVHKAADFHAVERIHRKAGLELGLFSQLVCPPMNVKRVKEVGTLGTTSLAWYIGRAVYLAKQRKTSIMDAIMEANPSGRILYTGKIISLTRHVSSGGYTEGLVELKPIGADEQEYGDTALTDTRHMRLPFQNEYLYAELFNPGQSTKDRGEILCTVPDLISLVGTDGYALGTQDLRYGVRVTVVAFTAHPHWYTEKGIEVGGPKEFGYKDLDFVPLGKPYYEPKRVTKEFRPSRA